jgi:hypothetical protein
LGFCFSDESDYAANIEKVAFSKQEKINSSSASGCDSW